MIVRDDALSVLFTARSRCFPYHLCRGRTDGIPFNSEEPLLMVKSFNLFAFSKLVYYLQESRLETKSRTFTKCKDRNKELIVKKNSENKILIETFFQFAPVGPMWGSE